MEPTPLKELETEVFREDVRRELFVTKVLFAFVMIFQTLNMLTVLVCTDTERILPMYAVIECEAPKTQVDEYNSFIESLAGKDRTKLDTIKKRVITTANSSCDNALKIGKDLLDAKNILCNDLNNDTNFSQYAEIELGMKRSTAYDLLAIWDAWQGYNFKALPVAFTPSAMRKLADDGLEELRTHIFGMLENNNRITVEMAVAAKTLFDHGMSCKKITAAAMRDPGKYLTAEEPATPEPDPISMDMSFDCGKDIRVNVDCSHCAEKPDDADVINALADVIERIKAGKVDN